MAEPVQTMLDKVTDRAQELNRGIVDSLVAMVPQPPGRVKLTEREQLAHYLRLTAPDMARLIATHGQGAVENYIFSMEKLRGKYGG